MMHILENEILKFTVCGESGAWRLLDKAADAEWKGADGRFGTVAVESGAGCGCGGGGSGAGASGGGAGVELAIVPRYITKGGKNALRLAFSDESAGRFALYVDIRLCGDTVTFSYDSVGLRVKSITLFDFALAGEGAALLLPVRAGLMIPRGAAGAPFEKTFGTYRYEGLNMAMLGAVANGAALMADWDDPHAAVSVNGGGDNQDLSAQVIMSQTARAIHIRALGKGGADLVGTAYRKLADEKGYLVTLSEKIKDPELAAKLYGSVNFKMWFCMMRRIDENLNEVSAEVIETFEEAGDAAEHLKSDLDLQRVFFILGGWMKMGYDAQHPDILPAAPECGGTEGLKACGDRVKAAGYVFGLHDNYQDMYRDAPSWSEDYIMKKEDQSLFAGGLWLGGRAYLTCSPKAIELAQRPQNLPQVKAEVNPDIYFIDTTYAANLYECYDKNHPLTQWDDMYYKQGISYYAKDVFGYFGSECGVEWALPCAEWFEGVTGVAGRYFHMLKTEEMGAVSLPLFDMVYHDCVVAHGKYHYDFAAAAEYVAHHASIGRTVHYHFYNQEKHRYWEYHDKAEAPAVDGGGAGGADTAGGADAALYTRGHNGWGSGLCMLDRFIKNTYELLAPLNLITTHERITSLKFLDAAYKVRETRFGGTARVVANLSDAPYAATCELGGEVLLPAYGVLIESEAFLGFAALSFGGKKWDSPALFTIASADGAPLDRSREARVFHGFGCEKLAFRGKEWSVPREEIIRL